MKKLLALTLAAIMTFSMLVTPASAFYVGIVSSSYHPITGELIKMELLVENENGGFDRLPVFDENGNQLYVQVGKNEWEKLDTPLPAEEVARQQAEAEKAEKAATAKKKAEMEKAYKIKITDDYAVNTSILDELEHNIKFIPEVLREKAAAQIAKKGKTLKIDDFTNGDMSMAGYAGYYTSGEVAIYLMSTSAYVHEYGHFIFMTALPQLYNSSTFKNEWNALKGGEGPTHVTAYAETDYQEDLAETFNYIMSIPQYIRDLSVEFPDCLVVKKANLMRDTLCKAFSIDKSVFPELTPSVPSPWAKAEIEEYQRVLGGSEDGVVPYPGDAHSTGYQKPATRLQFVYSISEDMIRNLYLARYFGNMSYDEFEKKWTPAVKQVSDGYDIPFTDISSMNHYYLVRAVNSMYVNGVINGKSATTFDPQGQITRQEAATILYRLCNALGYKLPKGNADNFADSTKIAPWAKDAVAAVSAAGIMNGVGNNNFAPTAVYSCEQSALTLLRTYNLLTK